MRIACPLGHRTFEKPKETSFAPCWPKVNWLTFGRTGRKLRKHQAKFVFVFGKYLSLQRGGRLSTLKLASQMFVVSGPGPATAKDASQADIQCHACRPYRARRPSWPARPARGRDGPITTASSRPATLTSPSS